MHFHLKCALTFASPCISQADGFEYPENCTWHIHDNCINFYINVFIEF
jgi:hypothetical protein